MAATTLREMRFDPLESQRKEITRLLRTICDKLTQLELDFRAITSYAQLEEKKETIKTVVKLKETLKPFPLPKGEVYTPPQLSPSQFAAGEDVTKITAYLGTVSKAIWEVMMKLGVMEVFLSASAAPARFAALVAVVKEVETALSNRSEPPLTEPTNCITHPPAVAETNDDDSTNKPITEPNGGLETNDQAPPAAPNSPPSEERWLAHKHPSNTMSDSTPTLPASPPPLRTRSMTLGHHKERSNSSSALFRPPPLLSSNSADELTTASSSTPSTAESTDVLRYGSLDDTATSPSGWNVPQKKWKERRLTRFLDNHRRAAGLEVAASINGMSDTPQTDNTTAPSPLAVAAPPTNPPVSDAQPAATLASEEAPPAAAAQPSPPPPTQPADRNVWDEPPDNPTNILRDGDAVTAATLNKLIERLTAPLSSPDPLFLNTVLLTYQSFTTPDVFLEKLLQRYRVPPNIKWKDDFIKNVQVRVANIIQKWLDMRFVDFDAKRIEQVIAFCEECKRDGRGALADKINHTLTMKRSGSEKGVARGRRTVSSVAFAKSDNVVGTTRLLDLDEEELARQLTLIDFKLFAAIQPTELLNQAWTKPQLGRSPNVVAMIQRFNEVSTWVAVTILKEETLRSRVRIFSKLIRVAMSLHKLNNFSSLLAFLAGFNNGAVLRLKWTKKEVPRRLLDTLDSLERLMNTDLSWKVYRETLHAVDPPCVPYLGVYLSDLIFIDEGNPDNIGELINLHKRKLICRVLLEIQQYQQKGYPFLPLPGLRDEVGQVRADEKTLYAWSYEREPRGAERSAIK